jgi:methyltransferase of ATP-grasp peptide maturase system
MTVLTGEWRARAAHLADELTAAGKLVSPVWREAICEVPRHEFVPDVFSSRPGGTWHRQDTATEQGRQEWLNQVYSNTALLTALTKTPTSTTLRSSSSMPGLMTRMLESLDVHDGHRVLEIGTGTGYNAALLAHRLGDAHVFSIDVEPDLIDLARQRLAQVGYHPTLVAGDGAAGLPDHALFDRIIATCAVPAVPRAWVDQTRPGGVILTDLKTTTGAGSLVRLTRLDDAAEGHFDPTYAAFMGLRHQPANHPPTSPRPTKDRTQEPELRTTTLDSRTPWTSLVVWFIACFDLGSHLSLGYTGDPETGQLTASTITAADGSWTEVSLAQDNGVHQVTEGGPRRLWRIVEHAHTTWTSLRQPGWDRFGLTVTEDHQHVWCDSPHSDHAWLLPLRENPPAPTLPTARVAADAISDPRAIRGSGKR